MSILVVVAHPDDEVLGVGGTAAVLSAAGHDVSCVIMCGEAGARRNRPPVHELDRHTETALAKVGMRLVQRGDFPNIELNTVPHLQLVQFIEEAIVTTGADLIFTHHPQDLNNDHLHTSIACQAACRLFQRRDGVPRLRALYYMEILSSTDWAFPGSGTEFRPDTFFELGRAGVEQKIEALSAYEGVMRDYPHPRSSVSVEGLAAYRGGQAGMNYAEAFQTAFSVLSL